MSDNKIMEIKPHDEIVLVEVLCEEMDDRATQSLQDDILAAGEQTADLPVVLDLTKVTYMPSLSIGAIVSLLTEFKKQERRFILVGLQPSVRGVLALTSLDRIFEIYDNVDGALEQIHLAGQ